MSRRWPAVAVAAALVAGVAVVVAVGGGGGAHRHPAAAADGSPAGGGSRAPGATGSPGSGSNASRSAGPAGSGSNASGSAGAAGSGSNASGSAGGPVPGPTAAPPPTGEQFGVNVNRLFNDRSYSPAQIDAQLAGLQATGATVARSDALWELSEPTPPIAGVHHYDWAFDDQIAGALAAHRLAWLPIIDYSAPWAQSIPGQDHSPPRSTADFAAYAAALATRYGPGGTFWIAHPGLAPEPVATYEIWNEPDNPEFWLPAPDPAAYAELYLSARDAITAVQPSARVIVGGLTAPGTFLPAMLRARPDLAGHLDGVAIHPYGGTVALELARVRGARRTLASLGLSGVPLFVTEFGWTTQPPGALDFAPERLRPGYIKQTLAALGHTDCGLAAAILYTWVTPERDPADAQDWFGIHPPAAGSSPDTASFAAGLRLASAAAPVVKLCG